MSVKAEFRRLDCWRRYERGWESADVAARFEAGTRGEDFLELLSYGPRLTRDAAAVELLAVLERTGLRIPRLLDFGCGNAIYRELFASVELTRGWEYVGVDVNPGTIESCRRRYPESRFEVVPDGNPLPFADGDFDLALASGVLEINERPAFALAELQRVTRAWVVLARVPVRPLEPAAIYEQRVEHAWGVEEHAFHLFNEDDLHATIAAAGLDVVTRERSPASGEFLPPDAEKPVPHFNYLLRKRVAAPAAPAEGEVATLRRELAAAQHSLQWLDSRMADLQHELASVRARWVESQEMRRVLADELAAAQAHVRAMAGDEREPRPG